MQVHRDDGSAMWLLWQERLRVKGGGWLPPILFWLKVLRGLAFRADLWKSGFIGGLWPGLG